MFNSFIYAKALNLAAEAHRDQKVPGTQQPYLSHLLLVCAEVIQVLPALPGADHDVLVAGALLHDCVEDTGISVNQIRDEFGEHTAHVVAALTKNADLPKEERMKDSLERIRSCGTEAGVIKLADRIINLNPPPHFWTREKRLTYRQEAGDILEALGAFCPALADKLSQKIIKYADYL